ncbi:hypothetical protein IEQ11_10455 [Lysobacter capsici]|uniref:hypothetical protein n=1 Tax=Lysobacter capsici TaxID=435897 RepID=UPI00177AB0E0|nr:hypothetical protein [Lysobacter capsici]UOF17015.1 hypothetical protein IEQ11_10455 [Lysobacter capsici]
MRRTILATGLALAAAGLLSGCGPRYYKPQSPGGGTATLNMSRGAMHLGGRSLQVYAGYRDSRCSRSTGTGRLGWMLTYATVDKTAVVDAGQRLYLIAGLHEYSVGGPPDQSSAPGMYMTHGTCRNLASFIPQAGHSYEIIQEQHRPHTCELRVLDQGTDAAPSDLTVEDPRNCPLEAAG